MLFQALSVIAPAGSRIRSRRKTIEVRDWQPDALPLRDVMLVQTDAPANAEATAGRLVATVDVVAVRPWVEADLEKSSAMEFQPGLLAWELENIRPAAYHQFIPTQPGLYEIDLDPRFIAHPEGTLADLQKQQVAPEGESASPPSDALN